MQNPATWGDGESWNQILASPSFSAIRSEKVPSLLKKCRDYVTLRSPCKDTVRVYGKRCSAVPRKRFRTSSTLPTLRNRCDPCVLRGARLLEFFRHVFLSILQ